MRTQLRFLIGMCISTWMLLTTQAQGQVVISQVYGGGGNNGSYYTHDYVELFNRGTEAVNINGWSLQYASASGSGWASAIILLPDFELQPGQYFLVQQAAGSGGTEPLPTPDFIPTNPFLMGASNLKLVLANTGDAVTGTQPTDANIVDMVGFGTANGFEGSVGPALSSTLAGFRAMQGCQDTNDNGADFTAELAAPRNSATPLHLCNDAPVVESVSVATLGGEAAIISTQGGTLQLIATVSPAEVDQSVTWTIEGGNGQATVSEEGLVTAIANGMVVVRATSTVDTTKYDEIEIEIAFIIVEWEVTVEVSGGGAAQITTDNGTLQLMATVTPLDSSQAVTWSVAEGVGIATVNSSGLVTALENGTVVIRATSVAQEEVYGELSIEITNQMVDPTSVVVTTQGGVPALISVANGTLQLVANVLPAGTNQQVQWSIANGAGVASVNSTGLVTAIANGNATVRATSVQNTSIYGEITVEVNVINGIVSLDSNPITLYPNPTEGVFFINSNTPIAFLTIYNSMGQKVRSFQSPAEWTLASLPAGIYTLEMRTNQGDRIIEKLIKQ